MAQDIAFSFDRAATEFDLSVTDTDLQLSDSLLNEILISLFTWRADSTTTNQPRMGYWGDDVPCAPDTNPESLGSLLWKLDGKLTADNINNACMYTKDALHWMTDDPRIESYDITSDRTGNDRLDVFISINMRNGAYREYSLTELQQITARGF